MSALGLNDHHDSLILNYLRFSKFQRHQCLKSIESSFEDASDTRLLDETYTVDEIKDLLKDVSKVVGTEIESELINASHMNVLLLQQVFGQAEKWHLDLEADLAEMENRELLDKIKQWEETELSSQPSAEKPHLSPTKKKLAPLNEGGPTQLLNSQIAQLNDENSSLKSRIKDLELKWKEILEEKNRLVNERKVEEDCADQRKDSVASPVNTEEIKELENMVSVMKTQIATKEELNAKNQHELESDLTSTKHKLLEMQHQLSLAEKELEKKFSQTGAYKNLKKMLVSKNDQIKELRQKLALAGGAVTDEEEEE